MKNFKVTLDVTLTTDIDIKANSKKEAIEIAKNKALSRNDLQYEIHRRIVEVIEN